jgi:hypothetical protein
MGFFKNLSRLKFGKIAKNASKNISNGVLFKGAGFLDKFGSKALSLANGFSGGLVSTVGGLANSVLNSGGYKPSGDEMSAVTTAAQFAEANPNNANSVQFLANLNAQQRNKTKEGAKLLADSAKETLKSQGMMIDVNNDGKDDTTKIVIGAAALAALVFFMKRK